MRFFIINFLGVFILVSLVEACKPSPFLLYWVCFGCFLE